MKTYTLEELHDLFHDSPVPGIDFVRFVKVEDEEIKRDEFIDSLIKVQDSFSLNGKTYLVFDSDDFDKLCDEFNHELSQSKGGDLNAKSN